MASPVPSPMVVSTSQVWDKDAGGSWSTFFLNIGTPPQPSRVIISTSSSETWVVGPEGCPQKYGSNCEEDRGLLFSPSNSTSWTVNNNFSLFLEEDLGYHGNGQFGFDTVSLGYTGSGGRLLEQQTVAAIASPDYWLGLFGLDPAPRNFTNMNEPRPSILDTLATRNMIPSLSWGYTAGANYRARKPQGSLTLGGYDSDRFTSPNLTLRMYDDVSHRFMVELKSISYTQSSRRASQTSFLAKTNCKREPQIITTDTLNPTTNTTLMTQPISITIDSTVAHLYLPQDLCERFEEAFGLVWLSNNNTYAVNTTAQPLAKNSNLNITFTLADPQGKTLNITFPYSAFNATVQGNVTSPKTLPFPLKRAMNDTQYTLGRTFLQEAYIIADYQRSIFTIAPCTWPSTLTQDIKSILPPSAADSKLPTLNVAPKIPKRRLLIPAILVPILLTLSLLFLFRYIRHKRKQHKTPTISPTASPATETTKIDEFRKPELDTACNEIRKIDGVGFRAEIEGKELQCELDGAEIHEMPPGGRCN